VDLDQLQSVQSRERQTDSLQQLRASFYQEAGEYIQALRTERAEAAEQVDDPFDSPAVTRLTDDISTAEQTVEAIYERRVGKIVKMASLAAAGMPTEEEGLTTEERALFETLVDAIEDNRQTVLDVLAGARPASDAVGLEDAPGGDRPDMDEEATDSQRAVPPTDDPPDAAVDAADLMGGVDDGTAVQPGPPDPLAEDATHEGEGEGGSPPGGDADGYSDDGGSGAGSPAEAAGSSTGDVEQRTVRVTEDVGEILGVDDRDYDLAEGDVVTLPATNADPLIERDAAEPLE
jgi:DNA replication factor GINS